MSKQQKKSCPPKKHRRARSRTATAKEWHDLADEFLDRSSKHPGRIRLLWEDGRFDLFYVQDSPTRLGEEVVVDDLEDAVRWCNPALESIFRRLATHALLLAGRRPGDSVWQSWAELLVDTVPYRREAVRDFGHDRASYLRSQTFHFVDESVEACNEMGRSIMMENLMQPAPRLYARGLRALRERMGYKQAGLAEILRCSEKTVGRWENEKRPTHMNEEWISRVCAALECSREELLGVQLPKAE